MQDELKNINGFQILFNKILKTFKDTRLWKINFNILWA